MNQNFFSYTTHSALKLGPELGRGGEGIVYQLENAPGCVAKIYHAGKLPPIEKLRLMLHNPPEDPTSALQHVSIVWLTDLVQNHKGQILGIVMPKIPWGIPIHQLYHPRSRREKFIGFDWLYLHRSAANLAAAVAAIHAKGYVIGDLNESNVLVQPTALVSIIDTDSFQTPNPNGETFRCRVGKPEFTAPELQDVRLSTIDRSEEHDRFALAVMIFLLLMEGSHPFRGIGGPHELGERIQQGLYPYSLTGMSPSKAPPLNPPFRNLHPEIQQLFQTCFVDGFSHPYRRPRAAVWADALSYIESDFTQCSRNRHHVYLQTIPQCPWCERTQLLRGRDPFPEGAPNSQAQPQKTPGETPAASMTTPSGARKARKYSLGNIFAILLVLGIAAALIVPGSMTAFHRSKLNRTKRDMRDIMSALETYRESRERYPKTRREIDFHKGLLPKKLYDGTVRDAWGTPFRYHSNDEHYRLVSYGKDKLPGQLSDSEFDADVIFEDGKLLAGATDVTTLAPLPPLSAASDTPAPEPTPASIPETTPMPTLAQESAPTPSESFFDTAYQAYWKTYLQGHPEDADARLKLAHAYDSSGRFDDVIRECLELLKYDPDSLEGKMLLAWAYARKEEELDRALELAQEVVEIQASTGALYVLGGVYYGRDEYEKAIQTLKHALENPDEDFDQLAATYRLLGLSYERLEQYELALEAIDQSLAIAPNYELSQKSRKEILALYGAESPKEDGWEYSYKSEKTSEAFVIHATDEGGYLVTGQLERTGLLLKLDTLGKLKWQKMLELEGEEYSQIRALQLTDDGDILVAGHTQVAGKERLDRLFCSLSQELEWDCTSFQSPNYDIHEVNAMQLTPDGGFAMSGCVQVPNSDDWRIMAQQFDAERNLVWGKYYFPTEGGFSCGLALQIDSRNPEDWHLIVAGTWLEQGIVYKLDSRQEVAWDERFKGSSVETIKLLPDGGFLVAGKGEKNWFTRLDADGTEVWGKFFNDPNRFPSAFYRSKNGDYVLAGYALPSEGQKAEVWVMRVDMEGGEPEYLHEVTVNHLTEIASITQAADGSYVLAGHYVKDGLKKLWVIKLEK